VIGQWPHMLHAAFKFKFQLQQHETCKLPR
jgi:hypothetical protein